MKKESIDRERERDNGALPPPIQARRLISDCCPIAEMDSSKILPASEECSSSESGWTMYIASPDLEQEDDAENEDDDVDLDGRGQQGYNKPAKILEEAAADSDDSMASDASSGPSDQRYSYGYRRFGHAGSNNERNSVAKKHTQREEKKKQIKGGKDKSRNKANSGGRLKKF